MPMAAASIYIGIALATDKTGASVFGPFLGIRKSSQTMRRRTTFCTLCSPRSLRPTVVALLWLCYCCRSGGCECTIRIRGPYLPNRHRHRLENRGNA